MRPLQLNWRMEEKFERLERLGEGGGGFWAGEEGRVGGGFGRGGWGEHLEQDQLEE